MCSLIMPHANKEAMNVFINTLSDLQNNERIILCMYKAGWYAAKQLEISKKMIQWFLPTYFPGLIPVELIWREHRSKLFYNRTFNSMKDVEDYLEFALNDFAKDKYAIKKLIKINYLK